jgi:hypothetical protein
VGVGAGGSMVLRQPCRCRPPLGGHELLHRPVAALRLERRYNRSLFRGGLLHLRIRRQLGEELLVVEVLLLLALRRSWVLWRRQRRWRWGWWRVGTASREHGVGCQETARHFLPAVGGCEPTVEAMSYLFPADACCDAMARCPAAKLFLFAPPLLGAGDETSGDDEASVVPLIVGHALLGEWRCS